MRHCRVNPGAVREPFEINGLFLFHDTEQRMPPLDRPSLGGALLLGAHDLLAQDLQLGLVDLVQLHAQIENGDRHQLGGLVPAALAQRSPAFLERFKNSKQMFV
jgi:hypothetical protein